MRWPAWNGSSRTCSRGAVVLLIWGCRVQLPESLSRSCRFADKRHYVHCRLAQPLLRGDPHRCSVPRARAFVGARRKPIAGDFDMPFAWWDIRWHRKYSINSTVYRDWHCAKHERGPGTRESCLDNEIRFQLESARSGPRGQMKRVARRYRRRLDREIRWLAGTYRSAPSNERQESKAERRGRQRRYTSSHAA